MAGLNCCCLGLAGEWRRSRQRCAPRSRRAASRSREWKPARPAAPTTCCWRKTAASRRRCCHRSKHNPHAPGSNRELFRFARCFIGSPSGVGPMAFPARFLTAATLALSLAVAPAVYARDGHGGERHGGDRGHHGGNVGGAVIGGLIGLGLGAAIAGSSAPPAYYEPPSGYYAPPPPAVYYGY